MASLTFPVVPEEVRDVGDACLEENHEGNPHVVRVLLMAFISLRFFSITGANIGVLLYVVRPLESLGSVGETVTIQRN